ncbi:MAG: sulfite exporter TauE/SafE family protein [Tahibacter sp.]
MNSAITIGSALLIGLAASAHCAVMCGGIAGALSMALPRDTSRSRRLALLLGYQAGRIGSYVIAGVAIGAFGWLLSPLLESPALRTGLRLATALLMLASGLALLGRRGEPGAWIGIRLWTRIAPLARRLLPIRTLPHALLFGSLWGWMPCGFVYSVLLLAWLAMDPLHSGATMLAFGLGTLPALLATQLGAPSLLRRFGLGRARTTAGVALLAFAVLTASGPWLASSVHPGWIGLFGDDCVEPASR